MLDLPQPITTIEARSGLSAILGRFRADATAQPVVFGNHRRAEAVVMPFAQFERMLEIVEDQTIAPTVAERIASGGGRDFDELLDDLGMHELKSEAGHGSATQAQ